MKKIPLGHGVFATVDDADEAWLSTYSWWSNSTGYAEGCIRVGKKGMKAGVRRTEKVLMHRLILGLLPGEIGDHINMNTLDNRRSNLRKATKSQNMANSKSRGGGSKYKGVHWVRTDGVWRAAITVNTKTIVGGRYLREEDAACRYNEMALQYFGEFALLNELPVGFEPQPALPKIDRQTCTCGSCSGCKRRARWRRYYEKKADTLRGRHKKYDKAPS